MTRERTSDGVPVFSPRLDEVMAAMIKGVAPNAGRFCGHCYTPLGRTAEACAHCGTLVSQRASLPKIPAGVFALYTRMRKRESLIVNSFAFAGLGIGLVLFIALVALAVYRYDASLWMLAAATAVLFVFGRVFAGILGGWIGDQVGYDYARRKLVEEWASFARERDAGPGAQPAQRDTATTPSDVSAAAGSSRG